MGGVATLSAFGAREVLLRSSSEPPLIYTGIPILLLNKIGKVGES